MEDYIYQVYKKGLQKEMEQDFEKENLSVKATFHVLPTQRDMRIVIVERYNLHFVSAYNATDFNCVHLRDSIPAELLDLPKSNKTIDHDYIKIWYLRWMNKHFEAYKEDYKAYINEQADKDLGL